MKNNQTIAPKSQTTDIRPEVITWYCPYCDYSHSKLTNLRDHITKTIEGNHEGVSGWSPTKDIVATDDNGDIIRTIEGSGERPDEDHHLEHGDKKKLIINAWLELDQERNIDAITSILPVSEEYARRLTKQLKDGEIPPEEYREFLDWDTRSEIGERLEQHYGQQKTQEQHSMSLEAPEDELQHGSKKKRIINAYLINPDISPSTLKDVLDSGYEYIRRILKQLRDGDISQEEIDEARDVELQAEIERRLKDIGAEESLTAEAETETVSESNYMDKLNEYTKKSRILNSVLLARDFDEDIHYSDMEEAANCSNEYARRTTKEIREGDITEEELEEAADEELQELLEQFYVEQGIISHPGEEVSVQAVSINLDKDDPFEDTSVSKREALINVFEFRPDISRADAADLAGASAEYARQTYNAIQEGDIDTDEYYNEAVQNALEDLDQSGDLAAFLDNTKAEEEVAEETETMGVEEALETAEEVQATDETKEAIDATITTEAAEGMVPAAEIERIKDRADLLLRQARFENEGQNKKAVFIAQQLKEDLENAIENAE
jgi:hypothetical protein